MPRGFFQHREKRGKPLDNVLIPDDFPIDQAPVKIAQKFKKPIFLINGGKDFRAPVWMSEKILALLPKTTPQQLVIVPQAAHGGMECPMIVDSKKFFSNLVPFLEENL